MIKQMNRPPGFLSILGINEDGIAGLGELARVLLSEATMVVGGARHLALAQPFIRVEPRLWPSPISAILPEILAHAPHGVAVLASGDPFCFGVGPLLADALSSGQWHCVPQASCLTMACAHLGWAMQDTEIVSFCGRPLAALVPLLHPGTRVLALSADAATPAAVAAMLTDRGFGPSRIHVLEALGGPRARIRTATAQHFVLDGIDPLNMLAIEVQGAAGSRVVSLAPGLNDSAYAHDGQLTKQEIRAATLAALAPRRHETLWDIGTGSGSIAIEWALRHRSCRAIAIDRNPERLARAQGNAEALGAPGIRFVAGVAPAALAGLPPPDAVFIGGGARDGAVIATAWQELRPGGRLVVNAVTVETEAVLFQSWQRHGGTLTRLGVERLEPVGRVHGFRPAMTITQWAATKPDVP